MSSHWIEDLPLEQLKLFFPQFQQVYKEFIVLSEMTTNILASMGQFIMTEKPRRRSDRIPELAEEDEQEMTDGIFQSQEQLEHLRMDDQSTYEANSPRRMTNDGQGVYESVHGPITPKRAQQEEIRLTLGMDQTTGANLVINQQDMVGEDMNFQTMVKKKISVEDAANQIDTSEQLDLKFATIKPKDNKSRGMDIKIQNKDPAYEIKSVDKANKGSGIKTSAAPV